MPTVTVRRLYEDHVGTGRHARILHDGLVTIPKVAAEQEIPVRRPQLDARGSEDVSGIVEYATRCPLESRRLPVAVDRLESLNAAEDVVHVVERRYVLFTSTPRLARPVRRIFNLKVGGVCQHQPRDLGRRSSAKDLPPESISHQARQETCVVEVSVREENSIETLRIERERISVVLILVARTLEEPAVEKNAQPVDLHEMA
jgi:hypothetical protein